MSSIETAKALELCDTIKSIRVSLKSLIRNSPDYKSKTAIYTIIESSMGYEYAIKLWRGAILNDRW